MKIAGRVVFTGPRVLLFWAQTLVVALLVPAGFMAVVLIVKILLTGNVAFSHPLWFPATFIAGAALSFWIFNQVYLVMAQASVSSRFGGRVRIAATSEAFVFAGGRSEWRMVWADIDGVENGRRTIVVCTGGVALPVPHSAFASPEIAQEAYEQMARWHREAIA
jgi:hypothetical protein